MPDKENKISKIDPAVAMIMAVGRAMLGEIPPVNVGVEFW